MRKFTNEHHYIDATHPGVQDVMRKEDNDSARTCVCERCLTPFSIPAFWQIKCLARTDENSSSWPAWAQPLPCLRSRKPVA